MKRIKQVDVEAKRIFGVRGHVDMMDVETGIPTIGVRVVAPNSYVPPKPHIHAEKQVIYLISGTLKITNGLETISLQPGDFVLLDSNEEHYVMTDAHEAKVFEVKY